MKTRIIKLSTIAILLFTSFESMSQDLDNKDTLRKEISVEPYFGGPNLTFQNEEDLPDLIKEMTDYSGYGIFGLNVNYFLEKDQSLGLDAFICGVQTAGTFYVSDTTNELASFQYNVNRIRIQLRYTSYSIRPNSKFVSYKGIGFGYNAHFSFFTTRELNSASTDLENKLEDAFNNSKLKSFNSAVFPFSMRLFYGVRFQLNENIAFNTELGLGGGLFRIGVNFRY